MIVIAARSEAGAMIPACLRPPGPDACDCDNTSAAPSDVQLGASKPFRRDINHIRRPWMQFLPSRACCKVSVLPLISALRNARHGRRQLFYYLLVMEQTPIPT